MGRGVTSAPESPGREMPARLPVRPMRSRGVRGVAPGSVSSWEDSFGDSLRVLFFMDTKAF